MCRRAPASTLSRRNKHIALLYACRSPTCQFDLPAQGPCRVYDTISSLLSPRRQEALNGIMVSSELKFGHLPLWGGIPRPGSRGFRCLGLVFFPRTHSSVGRTFSQA